MTNTLKSSMKVSALVLTGLISACGENSTSEMPSTVDAVVGAFGSTTVDPAKVTHIIAVGYSHGQGSQFVQAAIGRAQKYRDIYPNDQIVLLGQPEINSRTDDREAFRSFGISVTEYDPDENLTASNLLARLETFSAIASFDYYGHSAPWSIGVSSTGRRFGTDTDEARVRGLATRFTGDGYATLNGCNAGLYLAPHLSRLWQIPVSGASTGTNFQRLHENGQWYVNDDGRFPEGNWATTNSVSYEHSIRCSHGVCLRLKPENAPYQGYWGNSIAGGLGFFKFFCKNSPSLAECKRRMALSVLAHPSTTRISLDRMDERDFKSIVFDYLCPNDKNSRLANECQVGIEEARDRGDYIFSVFQGNELDCSFNGCDFRYECDTDSAGTPVPGTCSMTADRNRSPKSLAKEFAALIDGFKLLRETGLKGGQNPVRESTGPIPRPILEAAASFTVVSSTLNCREEGSIDAEIAKVLTEGHYLASTAGTSGGHLEVDGRGATWVRVRPEGESFTCFVSGKYQFISPN